MEIIAVILGGYVLILALQGKFKATADKHFDEAIRLRDSGDGTGQIVEASRGCVNGIIVILIGILGIAAIIGFMAATIPPRSGTMY